MANRKQMISNRSKELLAQGYPKGIVKKAMDWAAGSADGMADYYASASDDGMDENQKKILSNTFLPKYLADCEKWIRSFGHEPKTA
jgi:hypothetical protein